jgi:hypothetical protein
MLSSLWLLIPLILTKTLYMKYIISFLFTKEGMKTRRNKVTYLGSHPTSPQVLSQDTAHLLVGEAHMSVQHSPSYSW